MATSEGPPTGTLPPPGPPPSPPGTATAAPPPERPALTSVAWSEHEAFGLVLLTLAVLLGTGGLAALPAVSRLGRVAPDLVKGGLVLLDYGVLLAVVALLARRHGQRFGPAVGLHTVPLVRTVGVASAFAVLARFAIVVWVFILDALGVRLPGAGVDITRLLPLTPLGVTLTVIIAAVAAPIAEEAVFRGVLVSALLRRRSRAIAYGVSAAVFAILHFNAFTFVPILMLGVGLAWLFERSRSLWTSVAAHSVFNLIAVAAAYAVRLRS